MIRRAHSLLIAASILCGCSKAAPRQLDLVRIADRGFMTNAPIYIAEADGFFADAGIRLEYTEPPRSSSQMIPLLERGSFDVMASQLTAAFFAALAQGGKSRIVADRGHVAATGCDYDGVMARRGLFDKAPPTAASLRGKRFSLSSAGSASYATDKYLESLGLSTKDLNMVRLGESLEAQALDAGTIDGLHVAEPHLSELVREGHKLIGPARVYAPGMHYAVLIFGPSLTINKRDVGQRFMEAYLRGVKEFHQGLTPRNVDIIAKRTRLSPDALRKICLPTISADGELNDSSLLDFQKWAQKNGYLQTIVPENGTDMTFARQAARKLGIASSR
jgi:NitT/TauT family transport system substrate-binding protein